MTIPETPEWLPAFKGSEHSFLDCEILLFENVEQAIIESEWNNQDTIWFDYTRLHSIKAFYFFAHCYRQEYGRYLEHYIEDELKFRTGLKGDALLSREVKQLFAVKRIADKHGMPYGFLLHQAFLFFASRGWTRPPRPSHIATNEELIQAAIEAWAEHTNEIIVHSGDPWFTVDHWVAHKSQARYEDWLVANLRLKKHPHFSLSSCLYERKTLRIERALQEFGEPLVRQAQEVYVSHK